MNHAHSAALGLFWAVLVAPAASAQTPPRPGPATKPAATAPAPSTTKPAAKPAAKPAVDRSTPDKTWAVMCAAVKSGDLAGFRACCYNKNEVSTFFMDAYSDTLVTTFALAAAMAKLDADGQAMSKSLESTYTDLVQSGENRKSQIDGDSARWYRTVSANNTLTEESMYFKKVGSDWLLDTEQSYNLNTADGRKSAEDFVAAAAPTLQVLKAVLADIQAKKITTAQQMRDRMAKRGG